MKKIDFIEQKDFNDVSIKEIKNQVESTRGMRASEFWKKIDTLPGLKDFYNSVHKILICFFMEDENYNLGYEEDNNKFIIYDANDYLAINLEDELNFFRDVIAEIPERFISSPYDVARFLQRWFIDAYELNQNEEGGTTYEED